MVCCHGMVGPQGGEVASRMVAEALPVQIANTVWGNVPTG